LYEMVKNAIGLPPDEDSQWKQYRPHHGIHLGVFRLRNKSELNAVGAREGWGKMAEGVKKIMQDELFDKILNNTNGRVKTIIEDSKRYFIGG
jgi:hypothetical protein